MWDTLRIVTSMERQLCMWIVSHPCCFTDQLPQSAPPILFLVLALCIPNTHFPRSSLMVSRTLRSHVSSPPLCYLCCLLTVMCLSQCHLVRPISTKFFLGVARLSSLYAFPLEILATWECQEGLALDTHRLFLQGTQATMFCGHLWRRAQKGEGASCLHFLPFCGIFNLSHEHQLLLIVLIAMTT